MLVFGAALAILTLLPGFYNSFALKIFKYVSEHNMAQGAGASQAIKLVYLSPLEPVWIILKTALLIALFFVLPYFLYNAYAYIMPAVTQKNRKFIALFLAGSYALFLCGAAFAYFIIIPQTLKVFVLYGAAAGAAAAFTMEKYFSFVFWMVMIFAFPFELPVLIVLLVRLGVVSPAALRKMRKFAYLGIAIFAAVITPDPTPFSMLILTVAMWILYEIGILMSMLVAAPRK